MIAVDYVPDRVERDLLDIEENHMSDSQLLALVNAMEAELPLLYLATLAVATHGMDNEDTPSSDALTASTEFPVSYSC